MDKLWPLAWSTARTEVFHGETYPRQTDHRLDNEENLGSDYGRRTLQQPERFQFVSEGTLAIGISTGSPQQPVDDFLSPEEVLGRVQDAVSENSDQGLSTFSRSRHRFL